MLNAVRAPLRRRWGVILLCAAALALLALPTVARNTLGIGITTVLTGSMRPAIDPGDLVVTQRTAASTVGIGDVIVAQAGTMAFAHRVVEVRPLSGLTRFTTRGDANPAIDIDPVMVSPQQGVEKVIWRVPAVGAPLAFLASPEAQRLGLSLLVAANLIALALFATRRRTAPEPIDAQPARGGVT